MNEEDRHSISLPRIRPRRLRRTDSLRALRRETLLRPDHFVYPLFVEHGEGAAHREIESMPGVCRYTPAAAAREAAAAWSDGVPAVLLFGVPAAKDSMGSENFSTRGIVQQAIRAIRAAVPEMTIVTDVCMCEYTDHGHCGVIDESGAIHNDRTLAVISRVARSHASAGADIVAPSGMIDGQVAAIRDALDADGHEDVAVLSYAVKYASAFYGPFRDAADGAPAFGDRRSHQMDPANVREALREASLDLGEGADMLMVKPALAYLDVIRAIRESVPELPLAAYNVSGEYSMIRLAARHGLLDERAAALEVLTAIRRAGADIIISYFAREAVRWLNNE